jgi:hypothetical protein
MPPPLDDEAVAALIAAFVEPLRRVRPIFDREGSLAALPAAARAFDWAPIRASANARPASKTEAMAEVAHKILGGIAAQSLERVVQATRELVTDLTHAVPMRLGVLVDSDRSYFRSVREAVGTATAWSRQHRLATGLEAETTDLPPVLARGAAAPGAVPPDGGAAPADPDRGAARGSRRSGGPYSRGDAGNRRRRRQRFGFSSSGPLDRRLTRGVAALRATRPRLRPPRPRR